MFQIVSILVKYALGRLMPYWHLAFGLDKFKVAFHGVEF